MIGDDLYTKLSAGLDEAVEKGHLPNPGAKFSEVSQRNATNSDSYLKALRTRLVDLGYLEDTEEIRESHEVDASFISAIKLFQKESAILSDDGWAGPKTWTVLQQLVSFEDEHEPRSWTFTRSLNTNTAIARAAWLRLWVMGFLYEEPPAPKFSHSPHSENYNAKQRVAYENRRKEQWPKTKLSTLTKPEQKDISIKASEIVSDPMFQRACKQFWTFASHLGLLGGEPPESVELTKSLLSVLFNYDEIIKRLGGKSLGSVRKQVSRNAEKFDKQFDEFKVQIDAIARIELWLLGYDCAVGAPQKVWVTKPLPNNRKRRKEELALDLATEEFWKDLSTEPDRYIDIPTRKSAVTPALFREFHNILEDEGERKPEKEKLEEPTDEESYNERMKQEEARHDELIGKVKSVLDKEENEKAQQMAELKKELEKTHNKKNCREIEAQIAELEKRPLSFIDRFNNLASSIWDGIKRIAKFIWRLIKGAVEKVVSFVKNLARFIAKEAREFFYVVVRAVDAVHSGIVYLSNSFYPKEAGSPFYLKRSADMDYTVLFDSAATNIAETEQFKKYEHLSKCYCVGCVVLGALAEMFRTVIGMVSGVVGWLRVLLSLGRFRAAYLRVKEAVDFLKDDENYKVTGKEPGALMVTDVV